MIIDLIEVLNKEEDAEPEEITLDPDPEHCLKLEKI
jgi:hypothetical protein